MRRITGTAAAVLLIFLATPVPGGATSVGVYGSAGVGSADWDDWDERDHEFTRTHDTRHAGAGAVLDVSAPGYPLGYRLGLGWERAVHEPVSGGPDTTLQGLVVDQDLTIALLGGPGQLRLWAGPELRLAFLRGSRDGVPGKHDFLGIGVGPVLGLDVDVTPGLAVSWKLGYLFTAFAGEEDSGFDSRHDSSFGEGHAYASVALLFHTWGGYRQPPPPPPGYRPPPPPPGYGRPRY